MLTGWQKIDEDWFYLNTTDGAMLTGWQKIEGEW
jgi:glucan-binding YG repeat protein